MKLFSAVRVGQDADAMTELTGDVLLRLPLRLHGIQLGAPVDVLLERQTLKVVGLDVRCGDEVHRFLPLPTAKIGQDEIAIASPLVLLEEDELDFYRSRTFTLSRLRGRAVEQRGRELGRLEDVVVAPDGQLLELVVFVDGRHERVPYGDGITLERRHAAA